jgi:hypothetical protein
LPNQRHDVDAKVLAPVLSDFFCASAVSRWRSPGRAGRPHDAWNIDNRIA